MALWHQLSVLGPRQKMALGAFAFLIAALYLFIGAFGGVKLRNERLSAEENHRARMSADLVEAGQTPPDPIPAEGNFTSVSVGLYLETIEALSLPNSSWRATFQIWFRWRGPMEVAPGQGLQLAHGQIEQRDLMEEFHAPDGVHYRRYRVTAQITKLFDTTRVPIDDHVLLISVEDGRNDVSSLRYLPDPASNVSSRVRISDYNVLGFDQVVKVHTYRTTFGDPRLADDATRSYSQYSFALRIERDGLGVYFKIFIGLFAGMALVLASFALRAADTGTRLSLLTGAYFGAVANSYLAESLVPSSGTFGLVEYVTLLGLFTIFLSMCATLISLWLWHIRDDRRLSRALDGVAALTIGTCFILVNIALAAAC